ncbi:MAG: response regulator [Anaerolineae bacterium]|nr:response regulator [Anaerolineae bacterium]
MAGKTVLVIDDSAEFVDTLKESMLYPLGYRVMYAVDGPGGLTMNFTHNPDLMMLNMNLPGTTGLEILRILRRNNCLVPVIFMTADGCESVAVEAFRLGVSDYLIKPFTFEEAQQAINRALQPKQLTCDQEPQTDNDIAVETVRQTAITLSHYINNPLMTLTGNLSLLQESLQQESLDRLMLAKIVQDGQNSVGQIETVMRILQQVTEVRQIPYHHQTSMIDVEAALRQELKHSSELPR